MKRIVFSALLSVLFVSHVVAQERNSILQNTWPLRSGQLLTMDRWSKEIRVTDITYDNFKQMERNIDALQRNARDLERIIKNQERIIREQQRTIDNLQRRLNNLERDVNNLRRQ